MQQLFYSLLSIMMVACTSNSNSTTTELRYSNVKILANDRIERPNPSAALTYGTRVRVIFNDLRGLTSVQGKVYPNLSLCVTNSTNDTLLYQADALDETTQKEGLPPSPVVLEASFLALFPFEEEVDYNAQVILSDTKGVGKVVYELPFTMQPNNLLELNPEGLTYKDVYIWDNTAQHGLTERRVYKDHDYILFFVGIEGLTETNNLVHPTLSVDLVDRAGERVVSTPNFIQELTETGVAAEKVRNNQLYIPFQFHEQAAKNPCQFRVVLGDRDSKRQLVLTSHFEVL